VNDAATDKYKDWNEDSNSSCQKQRHKKLSVTCSEEYTDGQLMAIYFTS